MTSGIILLLILGRIYRFWFDLTKTLSSGDWPYLFAENIQEFSWWPRRPFLWLEPYYQITAKIGIEYLKFPWPIVERIFWFIPFLVLAIFSAYYLTRSWLGVLIYTTNTYILMIVGGGQMGVALAYSLAPLVLGLLINYSRIKELKKVKKKQRINSLLINNLIAGFVLGVQIMLDPRVGLITIFAFTLYIIYQCFFKRIYLPFTIRFSILAILVALILNLFWLIPFLKGDAKELAELIGVSFLSFATFSNTISLLHPNWPENIFGKVYFMKPEFLFLPLLAFSILVWRKKRKVFFFGGLLLIGAFLAKGTQSPLGEVYRWLYDYFPGFYVFRDSTKFYLLIVIAYSVLIPQILFKKKLLSFFFLLFWLFTIREAIGGQLTGTFRSQAIPPEYLYLKDFLLEQKEYFTTFWFPHNQRFGFGSSLHPAVGGQEPPSAEELKELDVKYVIIPFDSQAEFFLEDRKYSQEKRDEAEFQLDEIADLNKLDDVNFGRITVYENRSF